MSKKSRKRSKVLSKQLGEDPSMSSIENSFLNETSFNSDIDLEIRQEIDKKFKRSSANAKYVFPRNIPVTETKQKKSPIRLRPHPKPKLLMEKSLPVMHKMTRSSHDSTGILANLISFKRMHKVTSSIRSIKEAKIKIPRGRNTPVLCVNNRAASHSRSKTPVYTRKENSLEASSK